MKNTPDFKWNYVLTFWRIERQINPPNLWVKYLDEEFVSRERR